ncbi:MAG TPA: LuxR C-terminal-related transcriptional regulator, partial [Chthoniobacterales bacterium]|nr:LuxR C-terminal-related transcriptional regulator [Chthoniobacterales bacterium]
EFDVLQLVITGMLNKQIAGELGIAEKTVKVYRGVGFHKLRITSVPELIRLMQKAGAVRALVGSGADSLRGP